MRKTELDLLFTDEIFSKFYKDGLETGIFNDHFKELGFGKFDVVLDIQAHVLSDREMKGTYAMFSARDRKDNKIIGYLGFLMHDNLHHKDRVAQAHALYVKPKYRNKKVAQRLLKFAESHLYHKHKCNYIQLTSNTNNSIEGFLNSQGYVATDVVYSKKFDKTVRADIDAISEPAKEALKQETR